MAAYQNVLWEVSPDGIGTLTINRPDRMNALSPETIEELLDCLARARDDRTTRVVVLTGAGSRAFSAGADLGRMSADTSKFLEHLERDRFVRLNEVIAQLGKMVIAKVRGYALAGGLGLMAACDFVIAADSAVFATPEIDVGIFPMMITAVLARGLPRRRLLDLLFTGRRVGAAEAEAMGLITRAVPEDRLDEEVAALARTLASKSPAATRLGKDAFYTAQDMSFGDALRYLQSQLSILLLSEDAQEGLAAFREKREPRWKGV